jgi:phage protein D
MIQEIVHVRIDGEARADLIPDIEAVEVEEHVQSADVFRVRLSIAVQRDGTWKHLDDPHLVPWKRVTVVGGYPHSHDTLIDGHITHADVVLSGTGLESSYLELTGMDASALMDLEERQLAWPNKKDSEIAREVFEAYGFSWEIEDTVVQHQERTSTIMQAESDIRFLRRLAQRNGFECFVRGTRGFFRSPNLQDPPQKVLALQFGAETNVTRLHLQMDATPPTSLEIRRIDPLAKGEDRERLTDLPRRALGNRSLKALRADLRDGSRLLKQQQAASREEMRACLRAGYEAAAEFITVSGEIDSRCYGAILRAKRLVTIKGLGASHSGLYYVTRVRHLFTTEGYTQSFEAHRNGLGRVGGEQFAAPPPPPIAALAGALEGSAATENRLLPAQAGDLRPAQGSR